MIFDISDKKTSLKVRKVLESMKENKKSVSRKYRVRMRGWRMRLVIVGGGKMIFLIIIN